MVLDGGEQTEFDRLVVLAQVNPAEAYRAATKACPEAAGRRPLRPAGLAHVAGAAALELGDFVTAERWLRQSLELLARPDEADLAAEDHLSLSLALAKRGRFDDALAHALEAGRHLDQRSALFRGRLHNQVAAIHNYRGNDAEALIGYQQAIEQLEAAGDLDRLAVATNNRALVHARNGDLALAIDALERAEEWHRKCGNDIGAMRARHNRGFFLARAGAVPVAVGAATTLFHLGHREQAARMVAGLVGRPRRGPATERVLLAVAGAITAYAQGDWRRVRAALRPVTSTSITTWCRYGGCRFGRPPWGTP